MRILIVGAGIAGLTLGALLRQKGLQPLIVDRASDFGHQGYMLALYPLGNRVLHGLGAFDAFVRRSEPMDSYTLCNGHGERVQTFDLAQMVGRFGVIRQLSRADLLEVLRQAAPDLPLQMATTVTDVVEHHGEVEALAGAQSLGRFDLVVGADGIHSRVRRHVAGEVEMKETGWGGWVWWAPADAAPHEVVTEYWGASRFVGVYPIRDRIGVIAAGPIDEIGHQALGGKGGARLAELFAAYEGVARAPFAALPADDRDMFFWKLDDCRAPRWFSGRVVLMGDSACAFLPTAGVGASMAMESAAVLADELGRTDAKGLDLALQHYETRRRKRAEAAQTASRRIASLMFVKSLPVAWGRDQLLRFYSIEAFAGEIEKSLREPI
jgi:2-polyprenyl-6-methoxyphenol hydroxylase-like FAD-dependent oxidoreductase